MIADTSGQIVTPTTPEARTQPVVVFDAADLALIRAYTHMLRTLKLEQEVFCLDCYNGTRESQSVIEVNNHQVLYACGCRMLFGQGPSDPLPTLPVLETGGSALIQSVIVPIVALSSAHADLFRRYTALLKKFHLAQAIRCRTCAERNLSDGTGGVAVSAAGVLLECRHRRLRAVGSALA